MAGLSHTPCGQTGRAPCVLHPGGDLYATTAAALRRLGDHVLFRLWLCPGGSGGDNTRAPVGDQASRVASPVHRRRCSGPPNNRDGYLSTRGDDVLGVRRRVSAHATEYST